MLLKDSDDLKEALFYLSQAMILDKKNKTLYNQRAMLYEQVIIATVLCIYTCYCHCVITTERFHRICYRRLPDDGGY